MRGRALPTALAALITALALSAALFATSPALAAAASSVRPPTRRHGASVARIVVATVARPAPGSDRPGPVISPATSWSRHATTLLVLGEAVHDGQEWVRVLLSTRPDGSSGWVPRDRVVLGESAYWIEVRLGARRLTVYRDGTRLRSTLVVIGAPATPTPTGLAAIYELNRQPDPHGFDGTWVLALTALSEVLHSFDGGPGRIGIHGRGPASLGDPLGSARSNGCVRVPDRFVSWMATRIPVGTPVRIRR